MVDDVEWESVVAVAHRDYDTVNASGDGIVAIADRWYRDLVGQFDCAVVFLVVLVGHCLRNECDRSRWCFGGLELQDARAYLGLSIA